MRRGARALALAFASRVARPAPSPRVAPEASSSFARHRDRRDGLLAARRLAARHAGAWAQVAEKDGTRRWRRVREEDAVARPRASSRPAVPPRRKRAPPPPRDPDAPEVPRVAFNRALTRAGSSDALLALYASTRPSLDPSPVNVATAIAWLRKLVAREVDDAQRPASASASSSSSASASSSSATSIVDRLSADARFGDVLRDAVPAASSVRARALSNIAHALGWLVRLGVDPVKRGAVSRAEWLALASAIADRYPVVAKHLIAQETAMSYNAFAHYAPCAERVSPEGWAALAKAACRNAGELNEQGVMLVLSALGGDAHERRRNADGGGGAWEEASEEEEEEESEEPSSSETSSGKTSSSSSSTSWISRARAGFTDAHWSSLARRLASPAVLAHLRANDQAASVVLSSLAKIEPAALAMDRVAGGWARVADACVAASATFGHQSASLALHAAAHLARREAAAAESRAFAERSGDDDDSREGISGRRPRESEGPWSGPWSTLGDSSWRALVSAATRAAPEMNAQSLATTLNAAWKHPPVREAISAVPGAHEAFANAAARALLSAEDRGNDVAAFVIGDAACKLPEISELMSREAWRALAERTADAVAAAGKRPKREGAGAEAEAGDEEGGGFAGGWSSDGLSWRPQRNKWTDAHPTKTASMFQNLARSDRMSDAMRYKRRRWRAMCASMASLAPSMNAAGVGLALNALTSRYKARDADATTAMTDGGWARMAEGVSRAFGAEGDDGRDDRLGSAAAAGGAGGETSAGGFEKGHAEIDDDVRGRRARGGASLRDAPGYVVAADVAMAVDAAKKFPDFAAALDAETKKTTPGGDEKITKSSRRTPPGQQPLLRGWDALAARVVSTIPWDPVHVTIFSSALGWLPALAEALARRPGGFARVVACFERRREDCVSGIDPDAPAGAAPSPVKWMEKTAAGVRLMRGHAEYRTYGEAEDRARLEAFERGIVHALESAKSRQRRDAGAR